MHLVYFLNIDILPDILDNDILSSYWKRGKYEILYFPRFQYEESISIFKMSGSISKFQICFELQVYQYLYINKYINILQVTSMSIFYHMSKKYINFLQVKSKSIFYHM